MNVKEIKAELILSPTQISLAPYTINPYRGCPFGCVYCYVQENKTIKKRNQPWGTFIDVKINAIQLLEKEIKNKNIKRVLLGSTVECYPPQEKNFFLSHNIIEMLNRHNIAVTILTKSCLIQRDLNLISQFKENKIYLTINFDSEKIKKLFEPLSSSISDRLNLLKQIQCYDIQSRVHIAPLIPYIQNIAALCEMVKNFTREISIELYNFKMGNWKTVKEVIKNQLPKKLILNINQIASNKKNYEMYIANIKKIIEKLNKKIKKKIILLTPDFDDYYKSSLLYD